MTSTHSAIVVVTPPVTDADKHRWRELTAAIEIAAPQGSRALEELGQNVWQVDFQQSPGVLARLIVACEKHDFAYRLLQFDAEPQWIRWNPNPRQS
jgi:hypothetical protein